MDLPVRSIQQAPIIASWPAVSPPHDSTSVNTTSNCQSRPRRLSDPTGGLRVDLRMSSSGAVCFVTLKGSRSCHFGVGPALLSTRVWRVSSPTVTDTYELREWLVWKKWGSFTPDAAVSRLGEDQLMSMSRMRIRRGSGEDDEDQVRMMRIR